MLANQQCWPTGNVRTFSWALLTIAKYVLTYDIMMVAIKTLTKKNTTNNDVETNNVRKFTPEK
jgi:hypothetical protein